ncbi:hypothetical protein NBO_444g0004, partial [Nosema bombycis CQ1]
MISVKNDKIIGFELCKKSDKLSSLNFYDINGQILNKNPGSKFSLYEVVMSNSEMNKQPIFNSFDYLDYCGSLENSYNIANGAFFPFVFVIHDLIKKTEEILKYNGPIFLKSWETLECIIKISNMLTQGFATVVIPSSNKEEYVKTLDEFKGDLEFLSTLFIELKDIIKQETNIYHEKNPEIDIGDIVDFVNKIRYFDEDLKKTGGYSIFGQYAAFLKLLQENPNDQPSNDFVKVDNGTNNSNNYNNTKGESQNPSQESIFDITVNSVEVDDTNNKDINETKEKPNVKNNENKAVDLVKQPPVDQDIASRSQKTLRICTYISIGVIAFGMLVGFIFYIFSK